MTKEQKPLTLLVTLQFQDLSTRNEFLEDIRPFMEYIRLYEPTCLAFEVLLSSDKEGDDAGLQILERYSDKDIAYLQIHKSSAAYLTFRPKLQAMQSAGLVTLSEQSFYDSGFGFVERA